MTRTKKLIEVSMPIEAINTACAREKSIRHGHPSTLHIYWARRPLAAARAVLFAQLIDDPGSRPDRFPTEEAQDAERQRLHQLIERAVRWEATTDESLLAELESELKIQFPEGLPTVLDPFAGGGAIPMEALRMGLPTEASDLNPLAVLLNKAMIEIPQKFLDAASLNTSEEYQTPEGMGFLGLANDVRYFAREVLAQVEKNIGQNYPKAMHDGKECTVIAWVWARTVENPNPAQPVQVPLVKSWVLSKRKGNEAYIQPIWENGQLTYEVRHGVPTDPKLLQGTFDRKGAVSIIDGTPIPLAYIKEQGLKVGFGEHLMAVIADTPNGRAYLSPTKLHLSASRVGDIEIDLPNAKLSENANNCWTPAYGLTHLQDLFTKRQLNFYQEMSLALKNLSPGSGLLPKTLDFHSVSQVTHEYAAAISTYLALAMSRTMDYGNSLCTWHNGRDTIGHLFSKQVIPMAWDFVESNPFSNSTGNFFGQVSWIAKAIEKAPKRKPAVVSQKDASNRDYQGFAVSTDPPYYDNVGYADLSDFFYPWLRHNLRETNPELFATVATPKSEELVADKVRQGSKDSARDFFVEGFNSVFSNMSEARSDIPITVYYAYKQTDTSSDGTVSTGWETLLNGIIAAGFEITATWPVRTEMANRTIGLGSNALASSVVLACRQRPGSASAASRRALVSALRTELPGALRQLIASDISPVDLAQSAIGPGMSVFSRYTSVQEPDGSLMRVRDALSIINDELDKLLDDQDADMDPDSRFCMTWYKQYGWQVATSGQAEQLATAKDTTLNDLVRSGIFEARAGKARLLRPSEVAHEWDPETDFRVSIWECVVRLSGVLEKDGVDRVASLMAKIDKRVGLERVKAMAFFAYHTAEKLGNSKDAGLFNMLVGMWSDITIASQSSHTRSITPALFDDSDENDSGDENDS